MLCFVVFLLSLPLLSHAATLPVAPGHSLQEALNRAQPGDTVQLDAGQYQGPVTIPRDGVTLQGRGHSTVIDASRPAPSWSPAPEMGSGVWKASLGSPQAMTAQGKAVWRISDISMGNGSGKHRLSQGASTMVNTAVGQLQAWDGIEALFGNAGGTTYLRFRNGQNPSGMDVRVSTGATIEVGSHSHVTIKNLKLVGGQFAVRITGGSGNVIDGTSLTHGKNRILLDGTATGTIIRNNTLRLDAIGFDRFPPGDRDTTPVQRQVSRWMYDTSKFLIGDTETNDASILLGRQVRNTQILDNDIGAGLMGIVFYGTTSGTVVQGNRFHHFADIGIYVNADSIQATIRGNTFDDSEHALRLESMHRSTALDITENCFVGRTKGAKHIFVAPPKGGNSPAKVQVVKNTFSGHGWAVDMGGTGEFAYTVPGLSVRDNLIAVTGISSGGTRPIGTLANNQMRAAGTAVPTCQPLTDDPPTIPAPSEPPPVPRNLRILPTP